MIPFLARSKGERVYAVRWDKVTGRVCFRVEYDGRSALSENEMVCSKYVFDNYARYRYVKGILIEQPE
jgi:hypothetical protein